MAGTVKSMSDDLLARLREAAGTIVPIAPLGSVKHELVYMFRPEQVQRGLERMREATQCPPHAYYCDNKPVTDSAWPGLRVTCDACWAAMVDAFLAGLKGGTDA